MNVCVCVGGMVERCVRRYTYTVQAISFHTLGFLILPSGCCLAEAIKLNDSEHTKCDEARHIPKRISFLAFPAELSLEKYTLHSSKNTHQIV